MKDMCSRLKIIFTILCPLLCVINDASGIEHRYKVMTADRGSIQSSVTKNQCYSTQAGCATGRFFKNKGVFVSLTKETINSAKNIIDGLVEISTKTTVNIVVHQTELTDDSLIKSLADFKNRLQLKNINYNVITVKSDSAPPVFLRDLALFNLQKERVESLTIPYWQSEVLGPPIVKEISSQCGFDFLPSFENNDHDLIGTIKRWNDSQRASLMGGNFLLGPNNLLFIGSTPPIPFDDSILKFLGNRFRTLKIELPSLEVGHIDEIFQFINDPSSKCNFAVLKASPLQALKFLRSRAKDEIIVGTNNPDFLLSDNDITSYDINFHTNITNLSEKLSEKKRSGAKLDKLELDVLEKALKDKLTHDRNTNISVNEILTDNELLSSWNKSEDLINKSLKKMISFIDQNLNQKCNAKIISLPVFLSTNGQPWFPNPINGEEIDGHYLYSKQVKFLYANKMFWDEYLEEFSLGPRRVNYENLNSHIDKIIKENTNLIPFSIDTADYDAGLGNLHCATNTIKEICLM